jgi:tetratricopeptide (TPR) repeat protein
MTDTDTTQTILTSYQSSLETLTAALDEDRQRQESDLRSRLSLRRAQQLAAQLPEAVAALVRDEVMPGVRAAKALAVQPGPESMPFANNYEARKALEALLARCRGLGLGDLAAVLSAYVGIMAIEAEEHSAGEARVMELVGSAEFEPLSAAGPWLEACNQLGILWCNRGQPLKGLDFLRRAEDCYKRCQGAPAPGPAALASAYFSALYYASDLEPLYTHTAFYLAQCYGAVDPPQRDLAAQYCLLTLRRQMSAAENANFSEAEWAMNCLDLSNYYTGSGQFVYADQCLQAARKMLPAGADPERVGRLNAVTGRYYRNLLDVSRKRALGLSVNFNPETEEARRHEPPLFPSMHLNPPRRAVADFEGARELFNQGIEFFNAALKHYVFDGYVTDHATVLQDISQLYRSLAHFEPDLARKIAMHKRRLALLEPLLQMNPNAYHQLYKGVLYEVAETQGELSDLLTQSGAAPKKINQHIVASLSHWHVFVKSFEHQGHMPEHLDEDSIDPFLHAHFFLARLYSRLIVPAGKAELENLTKALTYYRYIVTYVDKRKLPNLAEEVDCCRQMVELLPIKMDKIVKDISRNPASQEDAKAVREAIDRAQQAINEKPENYQ